MGRKKILIGSILAVALILMMPLSPAIQNKIIEDDLVELDVEFCGLGGKHTVKLTQQEYAEVELIFDEVQEKLSQVDSDYQAVDIFNEAIVKLDNYGLLGSLGIRQTQRLITRNYNRIPEINCNLPNDNSNYFCFIIGETNDTLFGGPFNRIIPIFMLNPFNIVFVLYILSSMINQFQPFLIGSLIRYFDAEGWVWSLGLNGVKKWEGKIRAPRESFIFSNVGVFGFSGINICINFYDYKHFYLGYANYVELETL